MLKARAPLVVDLVVSGGGERLELGHEVGLGLLQLVDLFAERGQARLAITLVGDGHDPVGEVGAAVRAEDPLGEELGDQGKDLFLVDQDVGRVVGVPGFGLVVFAVGDAGVVGEVVALLAPGLAEHPARAQVARQV